MKRVALAVWLVLVCGVASAKQWVSMGPDISGDQNYISAPAQHMPAGLVRIWFKSVYNRPFRTPHGLLKFYEAYEEIDCPQRTITVLQYDTYASPGKMVSSRDVQGIPGNTTFPPPGSVGATLIQGLCGPK